MCSRVQIFLYNDTVTYFDIVINVLMSDDGEIVYWG